MPTVIAPRGALSLAGAVLAGAISAVIFAVGLNHADSMVFFIVYLVPMPIFVAGLGGGVVSGVIALVVGVAGLLVNEPSNFGVLYAVIYGVPSVALIALALRHREGPDGKISWYPEGQLLTAMTLYPCALFILCAFAAQGHEGGLLGLTTQFMNEAIEPMKTQMDPTTLASFTAMLDKLIVFMPALTGVSWVFVELIGMAVAQSSLQKNGWNLRNGFSLQEFHMPTWLIYAVALTGVAGAAAPAPWNYIGANLSLILGLPFFFNGLAVVHAWADTHKGTTAILIVFYIVLSVVPFVAFLVALLGVIDQWANFRQRFSRKSKTTVN